MGDKISRPQLPQILIETLNLWGLTPNTHAFSLGIGFAQQTADVQPFVGRIEVKVNLRHLQITMIYLPRTLVLLEVSRDIT